MGRNANMGSRNNRVVGRLRRVRVGDGALRGATAARVGAKRGQPAKTQKERTLRRKLAQQRYRASPRGRYQQHKWHAINRGVPFELSFSQWLEIWDESGHWDERGNVSDGYVMQRIGDKGGYTIGNVYIGRHVDNVAERNRAYHWSRRDIRPDERDPDYAHVHSAPDIDSSRPVQGAGDPVNFPDVPF